jgi:predicted DNA-binding transcriptional regulator YafY
VYHPTTRVLAVLEVLRTGRRVSGVELAAQLEVDERTVRRYITMLQDLGVPIEGERGRYGGYFLRPGFRLPPLMFSDEEALAVVLGLLAARRLGLAVAAPAVEGALAKTERVLPSTLRAQVRAVQDTLTLDLPPSEAPTAGEVVVTVTTAAQQERQVRLRYRSGATDDETERVVDPYGLVYRAGRWYAVGYCHLRADLRVFRLDRVVETVLRDETFTRPVGFDCLAYVLQALALGRGSWEVEVLLETTLAEALRRIPPATATLSEAPDGVVLRSYEQDLDWIARYLAGLPWPMVVRRPPELRAELRRLAAHIVALADRDES